MKWVLAYFVLGMSVLLWSVGAFGEEVPPRPPVIKIDAGNIDLAKTRTYDAGGYKYMYIAPGLLTGSGPEGYLFLDPTPLIGVRLNQVMSSPWGDMYWHGAPNRYELPKGWMPYPNLRVSVSNPYTPPIPYDW